MAYVRDREDEYQLIWDLDRKAEKRAFETFIDFVMDRWARHPDMHVYHYAPYEPSAIKRLQLAMRRERVKLTVFFGRKSSWTFTPLCVNQSARVSKAIPSRS